MGVNRGLKFLATYMVRILPGVQKVVIHDDMAYLTIDKHYLNVIVRILKSHYCIRANCLLDIWGSDYPEKKNRFEVNYMLLSIKYNFRVVLRVQVAEFEGIESLTPVFNSAGWLEREVWDMYGVMFFNHKDLRRILTDYGFDGHPLRKDFPLSGFMEVRYDDGEKRVVYEPLEVAQEYRSFNFRSPWERL